LKLCLPFFNGLGCCTTRLIRLNVAGDKGYSSSTIRRYLNEHRIGTVIPTKANEAPDPSFDRPAYRERNVVERLINRLKPWRRIATWYEKRAANSLAMLTLAAIVLWL